jgi:hypothetical protein
MALENGEDKFDVVNETEKTSLPPCGRRPRDPENPYPCESNQPISNSNEHLKPKQNISNLFTYLVNNHELLDPELFFKQYYFSEASFSSNLEPTQYIQCCIEKNNTDIRNDIRQDSLFDVPQTENELPRELLGARRYLEGQEQELNRQALTNFLYWLMLTKGFMQGNKGNDSIKGNVSIPKVYSKKESQYLSRGICDAIYYEGIRPTIIYEFKLGDPDTYNKASRKTHKHQIGEYLKRMYIYHNYGNPSIQGQLIYFTYNPAVPFEIQKFSLQDS